MRMSVAYEKGWKFRGAFSDVIEKWTSFFMIKSFLEIVILSGFWGIRNTTFLSSYN